MEPRNLTEDDLKVLLGNMNKAGGGAAGQRQRHDDD